METGALVAVIINIVFREVQFLLLMDNGTAFVLTMKEMLGRSILDLFTATKSSI